MIRLCSKVQGSRGAEGLGLSLAAGAGVYVSGRVTTTANSPLPSHHCTSTCTSYLIFHKTYGYRHLVPSTYALQILSVIRTITMKSAGIAATCCALGASAFLLPPNLVPEHEVEAVPFVSTNAKNQVLELPCSSCAFSAPAGEEVADAIDETGDDLFTIQGGAKNLILNFTISQDGGALELNKVPIYPADRSFETAGNEWKVLQVPATTDVKALENGEAQGVPLQISGSGTKVSNVMSYHGDEIIPIKWQLLSLENQPMTVDEVAIQLIKTEEGELLILSAEHIDENMLDSLPPMIFGPPPPHGPPHGPAPKECKTLPAPLCRFVHAMGEKIEDAKHSKFGKFGKFGGCHGRKGGRPHHMPGHIKPHLGFAGHDERPGHHHGGPPHHMRPHGHHGHHHHRHHFMHAFLKGFVAVLIPVMAGIFVGLTVSIIGLVVGRVIGWLWIRVVRGGKRGYASVAQDDESGDEDAEAAKVYVHADELEAEAPPMYEDAPPYELADEKQEQH